MDKKQRKAVTKMVADWADVLGYGMFVLDISTRGSLPPGMQVKVSHDRYERERMREAFGKMAVKYHSDKRYLVRNNIHNRSIGHRKTGTVFSLVELSFRHDAQGDSDPATAALRAAGSQDGATA